MKAFTLRRTCWATCFAVPRGTPEAVADNVRRNLKAFMPGGGYVFNNVHNIQGEVSPENVMALYDTAYECGFY